jgi:hypothetical protein
MLRGIKRPQGTRKAAVAEETTTVIPIVQIKRNADAEEDEAVEEASIRLEVPVRTSRKLPKKPLPIPEISLNPVTTTSSRSNHHKWSYRRLRRGNPNPNYNRKSLERRRSFRMRSLRSQGC